MVSYDSVRLFSGELYICYQLQHFVKKNKMANLVQYGVGIWIKE